MLLGKPYSWDVIKLKLETATVDHLEEVVNALMTGSVAAHDENAVDDGKFC